MSLGKLKLAALATIGLDEIGLDDLDFLHISGPTACGKTNLAHELYLSKKFSRIINADSRQFYQDLNIGTAKPTKKQQEQFHYCLVDFLKIGDPFSSHLFHEKLKSFAGGNGDFSSKPSLIVGGPSLYTQGLFFNLPKIADFQENSGDTKSKETSIAHPQTTFEVNQKTTSQSNIENPTADIENAKKFEETSITRFQENSISHSQENSEGAKSEAIFDATFKSNTANATANIKAIREKIEKRYRENGLQDLLQDISKRDPKYFQQMDRCNPRRAMRALEVMELTKKPYSLVRQAATPTAYRVTTIYLLCSRTELVEKIQKRTQEMLENGWMQEGEHLLEKYSPQVLEQINAVGYKHIFARLKGDITPKELVEKITTETWQLAKRQMTWIKKQLRQKDHPSKKKIIVLSKEIAEMVEKNKASKESCFFDQRQWEEIQNTIPTFSADLLGIY